MSGRRYEGWRHVRVAAEDRAAAQPYLSYANKLLGFVMDEADRNKLGVHSARRELDDGTVVIAEKHGDVPRITIIPTPTPSRKTARTVEGFTFTWAGDVANQTPVIFVEPDPEAEEPRDWLSMFYNSDAVGHAATPEDRRTSSYIDVFGVKAKDPGHRLLAGGGLWTDPETKEVVSWFRGYLGYWPHHYRHPRTNYSNSVSIYGHIAYAVPSPAWRVLAAAKHGTWLYVMIAEDLGALNPPDPPPQPSYSGQVWASQPYTDEPYTYSLRRYPLVVVTEPDTGVETYRADAEGGEVLWTGTLALAYGAWSFNADCTACVTVQLPRIAVWCQVYYPHPQGTWAPSPDQFETYPAVEAQRIEVAITRDESGANASAEVSQNIAALLLAEEDGVALTIEEVATLNSYSRVDIKLGDFALPLAEVSVVTGNRSYMHRTLIHAHLPTRTLLFYRWHTTIEPAPYVSAGYELYVDGALVPIPDPAAVESSFTTGFYSAAVAGNFLRVAALAYDDGVGTSWRRPMDAMTFLLGFSFQVQGATSTSGAGGEPGYGFQNCPHVPFAFNDGNYSPHSAAGGYVFGSSGGTPGVQYWGWGFTYGRMYGANAGEYYDPTPSQNPTIGHQGSAVSHEVNTVAVTGLQPMIGDTNSGSLPSLMNVMRTTRFGTNGDAKTLLDGAIPSPTGWQGFALGHTGRPRPHQRRHFDTQAQEA